MANMAGRSTAGAVDGNCLMDVGGTFTRSVSAPTNGDAFANSGSDSRRNSNGCWRNNVVGIAEPDMEIDDPMECQKDRVKLHNLSRNAIQPSGEGERQRPGALRPGGLGSRKAGDFQNGPARKMLA